MDEAVAFAAARHEGQVRRDGRTPYIAHPVRVARRIEEAGVRDEAVRAAAVLHDVVEDTPTPVEEIVRRFGPDVAGLVSAVTRAPGQTRRDFVDQIRDADPRACLVKLADRLDNLEDWVGMEAGFRRPYALEGVRIVEAVLANGRLAELRPDHARAFHRLAAELLHACSASLDASRGGPPPRRRPGARRR